MHELGDLPVWSVVPFVLVLFAIAILPLAAPHFWEHNRNKVIVTTVLALSVAIWFGASHFDALFHTGLEYFSFIALLGAFYVVAGGIHIAGDLEGWPATNTLLLGLGAVLANF